MIGLGGVLEMDNMVFCFFFFVLSFLFLKLLLFRHL